MQRLFCINYVISPTRPSTHVLKSENVECEVARLGTLRDSPLPRLLTLVFGSRDLGAGAKLPRAVFNFEVFCHMATQSVRLTHFQLGLGCVQSAQGILCESK